LALSDDASEHHRRTFPFLKQEVQMPVTIQARNQTFKSINDSNAEVDYNDFWTSLREQAKTLPISLPKKLIERICSQTLRLAT